MTLTADQELFKDEIEWTRPFEQLKLLREVCVYFNDIQNYY